MVKAAAEKSGVTLLPVVVGYSWRVSLSRVGFRKKKGIRGKERACGSMAHDSPPAPPRCCRVLVESTAVIFFGVSFCSVLGGVKHKGNFGKDGFCGGMAQDGRALSLRILVIRGGCRIDIFLLVRFVVVWVS